DLVNLMVDLSWRTIEFDNQQRLDIERVTDLEEGLRGMDRGPIHHFHPARNYPRCDYRRHTVAGIFGCRKAYEQRARCCWLWQDADGHFGDNPQEPFGPGHHAEKVIAL